MSPNPHLLGAALLAAAATAAVLAVLQGRSCRRAHRIRRRASLVVDGKRRRSVCVVCTGSVAAVKAAALCRELIETLDVRVDLVLTRAAEHFQGCDYHGRKGWDELRALQRELKHRGSGNSNGNGNADDDDEACIPWLEIWTDRDEWEHFSAVGDDVLHVNLAKRNTVLVMAPLCAHSLSALVSGAAPNLATSVFRAWYGGLEASFAAPLAARYGSHVVRRPVVAAPAMNTIMWHQRTTQRQLEALRRWGDSNSEGDELERLYAASFGAHPDEEDNGGSLGVLGVVGLGGGGGGDGGGGGGGGGGGDGSSSSFYYSPVAIVEPAVKTLACGDTGRGAMAEVADVVVAVRSAIDGYAAAEAAAAAGGLEPFSFSGSF